MPRTPSRKGTARTTGLIAAGVLACAFAMLLGWFWVFGGRRGADREAPAPVNVKPPDIRDSNIINAGGQPGSAQSATNFTVELADEKDPRRRAWSITAKKWTPLEAGKFKLEKPVAVNYMRDGRVLRFLADEGDMILPSGAKSGRPEAGTLRGGAVFELYEPPSPALAGQGLDITREKPALVGTTDTIEFDGLLGEIKMPGKVEIKSAQVDYSGVEGLIQINEAQQSLELLRLERENTATIRMGAARPQPKPRENPAAPTAPAQAKADSPTTSKPAGAGSGGAPAVVAAPVVSYYHLTLRDEVVVTQGVRTIRADVLDTWARLVDNRLPEGAIAQRGGEATSKARPSRRGVSLAPGVALAAGVMAFTGDEPKPAAGKPLAFLDEGDRNQPVVVRAMGPLEIRPLASRPEQLLRNDLALRFAGVSGRKATLVDSKAKARAEGHRLIYGATAREVSISSDADEASILELDGVGRAAGRQFSFALSTGLASVQGPGVLRTLVPAEGQAGAARELRWNRGSQFQFAVVDGEATSRLLEARPRGNVVAIDATGELRGEEVDASFASDDDKPDSPFVTRLVVRGEASASDLKGGMLTAQSIEAAFVPVGMGRSEPVRVVGLGSAAATRADTRLAAHRIDAVLDRDGEGKGQVVRAIAERDVSYFGPRGVVARADQLAADPIRQVVDLSGVRATLSQGESSIAGTQMRLEGGAAQRLTVFGAGDLRYVTSGQDPEKRGELTVAWSRQLTFDDVKGEAECAGGVVAEWSPDERAIDTIKGERLSLRFTPGKSDGVPLPGAGDVLVIGSTSAERAVAQEPAPQRRLLLAQAFGSAAEGEGEALAIIESKRYGAPVRGDTLRQVSELPDVLVYLESARISLENPETAAASPSAMMGVLSTPGPGRLLVRDHRSSGASISDTARSAKGDALFAWKGSMRMDREKGEATMREGVSMIHRRAQGEAESPAGEITELKCEELVARVAESRETERQRVDVTSVTATGLPQLRVGSREVRAGRIRYDASADTVEATPIDNEDVLAIDDRAGTTTTAASVFWKLKEQSWQIRGLRATTPR